FSNSRVLAYAPDGKQLVVSSTHNAKPDNRWESRILRWEVPADGAELRERDPLEWQNGMIAQLQFTADSAYLVAQSENGVRRVWPLWGNEREGGGNPPADTRATALAVGSRGHVVVASVFRGTGHIAEFRSELLEARFGGTPLLFYLKYFPVVSVCFSPDEGL